MIPEGVLFIMAVWVSAALLPLIPWAVAGDCRRFHVGGSRGHLRDNYLSLLPHLLALPLLMILIALNARDVIDGGYVISMPIYAVAMLFWETLPAIRRADVRIGEARDRRNAAGPFTEASRA